jgi:hypothetical protein
MIIYAGEFQAWSIKWNSEIFFKSKTKFHLKKLLNSGRSQSSLLNYLRLLAFKR